jgi:hypothetical protein
LAALVVFRAERVGDARPTALRAVDRLREVEDFRPARDAEAERDRLVLERRPLGVAPLRDRLVPDERDRLLRDPLLLERPVREPAREPVLRDVVREVPRLDRAAAVRRETSLLKLLRSPPVVSSR